MDSDLRRHDGRRLSPESQAGLSRNDGEIGFRTNVRAFIKRIRQKFRDVDPQFSRIKNYPGFGYRWLDGPEQ